MADPPSTAEPAPPRPAPWRTIVFYVGAAFALAPWATPQIALGLGVILALGSLVSPPNAAKGLSRLLIQACVILIGFTMDLDKVLKAGVTGLGFAAGTITATFAAGILLGRALRADPKVTTLVCSGTAICGGSAIAAVGSVIAATSAQMGVAIATVFILNGLALYIFPPIGHALDMSQEQFGTWAAVAIHDVSSVVGAGAAYGEEALQIATTVKLSRVLWIVPIAFVAAWFHGRSRPGDPAKKSAPFPWFILLFILACIARKFVPALEDMEFRFQYAAKGGMRLALFIIGCGLSRHALATVGWRALVLGVSLWVLISVLALVVVRATIV